jgi:hypothetical protein
MRHDLDIVDTLTGLDLARLLMDRSATQGETSYPFQSRSFPLSPLLSSIVLILHSWTTALLLVEEGIVFQSSVFPFSLFSLFRARPRFIFAWHSRLRNRCPQRPCQHHSFSISYLPLCPSRVYYDRYRLYIYCTCMLMRRVALLFPPNPRSHYPRLDSSLPPLCLILSPLPHHPTSN